MGVHCEINLLKPPDGVFVPGAKIAGVIKYAFDEETTIKGIIVSLKGSGYLRIRDTHKNKKNRKVTYRNRESYVDIDNVIQNDEKVFPIGLYETRFSFRIPANLPPTLKYFKQIPFYNIHCVIGYYVRIKFERPGMFKVNKHFKKDITFASGITPRYPTTPTIYGEQKKLFHLFSWKTSVVNMKTNVKSCVIPHGGKIELDYEVINDSGVKVKAVEFKLVETYTFKPRGHIAVRTHQDVIDTDSKASSVGVGETQKMRIVMNVPSEKTSIENCDMLSRDYFVKMTVVLPMPHFNATLEIPVQIGDHYTSDAVLDAANVYNSDRCEQNQNNPSESPYTQGAAQYDPSDSSIINSYDDPPPSYWEVMGEHNEDDEKDEDSD